MNFCRIATNEDFKECVIQYDHFSYMDETVKRFIEEDNLRIAISELRNKSGMDIVREKNIVSNIKNLFWLKEISKMENKFLCPIKQTKFEFH